MAEGLCDVHDCSMTTHAPIAETMNAHRDGPDANGRSLYLQFRCHALFAAAKPAWDLEAYRPAVPWARLIATGCNP